MSLRKFESLTPAGKRMRIARDVLAQLDAKKLIAKATVYVQPEQYTADFAVKHNIRELWASSTEDYGKGIILSEIKEPCKVCAVGSLLMCKVKYKNGITLDTVTRKRTATIESLSDYFDVGQLDAIELAFEGGNNFDWNRAFPREMLVAAAAYKEMLPDDEDRLRDIMHNIIANGGTFVLKTEKTPAPVRGKNQHSKQKPQWTLQSWAAEVDRRNAAGVELTKQEMFDRAWIGLKLQGFKRCATDNGSCVYKNGDNHCAWGWVDPDGTKDRGGTVYSLTFKKIGVAANLAEGGVIVDSGTLGFARQLQRAHDDPGSVVTGLSTDSASLEKALRAFAARHNLTIPDVP